MDINKLIINVLINQDSNTSILKNDKMNTYTLGEMTDRHIGRNLTQEQPGI